MHFEVFYRQTNVVSSRKLGTLLFFDPPKTFDSAPAYLPCAWHVGTKYNMSLGFELKLW